MIVELDGGQHTEQVEYDEYRTAFLVAHGYKVVRFWNNEILNNIDGVLEALTLTLSQRARGLGGKRIEVVDREKEDVGIGLDE